MYTYVPAYVVWWEEGGRKRNGVEGEGGSGGGGGFKANCQVRKRGVRMAAQKNDKQQP